MQSSQMAQRKIEYSVKTRILLENNNNFRSLKIPGVLYRLLWFFFSDDQVTCAAQNIGWNQSVRVYMISQQNLISKRLWNSLKHSR